MENWRIIAGVGFGFAFLSGFCLWVAIKLLISQSLHRKKGLVSMGIVKSGRRLLLQDGVRFLYPLSRFLLKNKKIRTSFLNIERFLVSQNVVTSPVALGSLVIALTILTVPISLFLSHSLVFSAACVVCLLVLGDLILKRKIADQQEMMREEIPSALQTMQSCFDIGYSIPQAFEQVSRDTEKPLKNVFKNACAILDAGGTLDESLDYIKTATPDSELYFLGTMLEIQHKTGGGMKRVFEIVRGSISDEISLKRNLQTQTAQAKLSAQIVTIMPFALIALFSLISPQFLVPFFESIFGVILLAIAFIMQALGIAMVRKVLDVEVA